MYNNNMLIRNLQVLREKYIQEKDITNILILDEAIQTIQSL